MMRERGQRWGKDKNREIDKSMESDRARIA